MKNYKDIVLKIIKFKQLYFCKQLYFGKYDFFNNRENIVDLKIIHEFFLILEESANLKDQNFLLFLKKMLKYYNTIENFRNNNAQNFNENNKTTQNNIIINNDNSLEVDENIFNNNENQNSLLTLKKICNFILEYKFTILLIIIIIALTTLLIYF